MYSTEVPEEARRHTYASTPSAEAIPHAGAITRLMSIITGRPVTYLLTAPQRLLLALL